MASGEMHQQPCVYEWRHRGNMAGEITQASSRHRKTAHSQPSLSSAASDEPGCSLAYITETETMVWAYNV